MWTRNWIWPFFTTQCFALCLLVAGCAGSSDTTLASVSGTVTLDGQPLPNALVVFEGLDGRSANGITNDRGYYSLQFTLAQPGAPIGTNRVRISTDRAGTADPKLRAQVEKVPDRYNINSAETVQVKPGSNTFNFSLTTP